MQRVDTTNPKAHAGARTIFSALDGDGLSQSADKFRMHLLGMYFARIGAEWGSGGKRETDYVHHLDVTLSGRRQVVMGRTVYNLERGHVWYLPANQPVARRCLETSDVIYFKFFCDCLPGLDPLLDWPGREPRLIARVDQREWRRWLAAPGPLGVAALLRLRCQLLLWLTDALPELDEIIARHLTCHAKFSQVFQLIEDRLGADLRLPALAEAYGTGVTVFAEAFSHNTGMTPKEYLTIRLNQEAIQRVINSDLKMKQIAAKLRFSDEFYFSRFFKKLNGCSPAAYRRRFRNG